MVIVVNWIYIEGRKAVLRNQTMLQGYIDFHQMWQSAGCRTRPGMCTTSEKCPSNPPCVQYPIMQCSSTAEASHSGCFTTAIPVCSTYSIQHCLCSMRSWKWPLLVKINNVFSVAVHSLPEVFHLPHLCFTHLCAQVLLTTCNQPSISTLDFGRLFFAMQDFPTFLPDFSVPTLPVNSPVSSASQLWFSLNHWTQSSGSVSFCAAICFIRCPLQYNLARQGPSNTIFTTEPLWDWVCSCFMIREWLLHMSD